MIYYSKAHLKPVAEMYFLEISHPDYENLKMEIIKIYQNIIDLEKVKEFFSCVIDSRRSLSQVKNLNDVFKLLEMRDVLDHNRIAALELLESIYKNVEVADLLKGYKKLHVDSDDNVCTCGKDLSFYLPIINPETENKRKKSDSTSALEMAFENIAMNIGKNWRVLASELKVPERYVDEVRGNYPSDMYQQALKILQVWKNYNEDKATLEALIKALDSRLCKEKGVGSHMLRPIIIIE